ncbi:MAG: hypothetical protein IKQ69_07220 [Oscillospiraceae bacterium]|nr:hypothetical protein [Oscillospiraceae bacterium]
MRRIPRFVWTLLSCLVCIIVTAVACLVLMDRSASSDKYLEVIGIVENEYFKETDVSGMADASAKAMVAELGDPSSYYMTGQEYEEYKLAMTNRYVGIGIATEYSEKYGFLSVSAVTPGSPADLAHIKVGNLISAVDTIDVSRYDPDRLLKLFQTYESKEREEDRYFTVHLLNTQGGKAEVRLKCELIYSEPVFYHIVEDTTFGYVKIVNFDDSAAVAFRSAVASLQNMGATALILDVRDNATGKPAEMGNVLDFLLPKGDLFLLRDRSGKETTYSSGNDYVGLPMTVIANQNTADAAEMFTCVMQQAGVTIVGRRTAASALSQTIVELEDGSAVRISSYEYLTPDKKSMSELNGVMPDVSSYMIEDSDMDVQLEAAKDVLS